MKGAKDKLIDLWGKKGDVKDYGLYEIGTIEPDQHWYMLGLFVLVMAVGLEVAWYIDILYIFGVLWVFEKAYNKGRARVTY